MFAYLIHRVRSALKAIRDDTVIPAVCFSDCNNAYIAAQEAGMTDALCALDSEFSLDLAKCNNCVAANGNDTQASLGTYVNPEFAPFVDFCAAQTAVLLAPTGTSTVSPIGTSTVQVILIPTSAAGTSADAAALFSEALASFSSQISSLSSFAAYNATRTFTQGYTTTLFATPTVDLGGAIPGSPSPTLVSRPPKKENHNWIAGAVIGPILLLSIIAFAIISLRRRKHRNTTPAPPESEDKSPDTFTDYKDKPQLHSDSIPRNALPIPAELPGHKVPVAELPAREPVAAELRASA